MSSAIDPAARIGAVALSVADLARALDYYQRQIGLALLERCGEWATLGVAATPLLRLREIPGARVARQATGLYHLALRVPARCDLARALGRCAAQGAPAPAGADHLVSEALYMADPDGHGLEIYCDRPRGDGCDAAGPPCGAGRPLDLGLLQREPGGDGAGCGGMPAGSRVGHIHLQVADLAAAERFYGDVLGFERVGRSATASFLGAGGYNHHIGINTWAGRGVPAPPDRAARLLSYELLLPTPGALGALLDRVRAAGIPLAEHACGWAVCDPSHNCVLLAVAQST